MKNVSYKVLVALIYVVVLFLDRLDLTIVNITLPTVAMSFHVPIIATDGINLAFLLALAISIPISNWLGEKFGFKKIFILAMVLFGLGSTLCAFASSLNALIFLRFLHGLGGGLLIPVGMTLVYRVYDKTEYASITSFTFMPSLLAPAIAPFLGGIILDRFGWSYVFLFSGPICLLMAGIALLYLREEPFGLNKPLDWLGFLLSAAILIDTFYVLSLLGYAQMSVPLVAGACLLPLLITAFIYWENKVTAPLIDLSFFRSENFVKANLLQVCFQTCHFGAIFIIGMFLQIGVGLSATIAGLMMGMQAIGAILTSRLSVKLFKLYGSKVPVTLGLLGVAILSPLIYFIRSDMLVSGLLLFLVRGIFSGLCGTPIQTMGLTDFSKQQIGSVNTILNACRQVAISFGVGISSVLMGWGFKWAGLSNAAYAIPADKLLPVFGAGFAAIPVFALLGIIIVQSLKTPVTPSPLSAPASPSQIH
jgi:EmrB/QacA subfamily drug resistance transporter